MLKISYDSVTSIVFEYVSDIILTHMENYIKCKSCNTKTRIFNDLIKMCCMCDDEVRSYLLDEFILGKHHYELYVEFPTVN